MRLVAVCTSYVLPAGAPIRDGLAKACGFKMFFFNISRMFPLQYYQKIASWVCVVKELWPNRVLSPG